MNSKEERRLKDLIKKQKQKIKQYMKDKYNPAEEASILKANNYSRRDEDTWARDNPEASKELRKEEKTLGLLKDNLRLCREGSDRRWEVHSSL